MYSKPQAMGKSHVFQLKGDAASKLEVWASIWGVLVGLELAGHFTPNPILRTQLSQLHFRSGGTRNSLRGGGGGGEEKNEKRALGRADSCPALLLLELPQAGHAVLPQARAGERKGFSKIWAQEEASILGA